ncbi:hypothetical protein Hte_000206 [Hypoxylon texense]
MHPEPLVFGRGRHRRGYQDWTGRSVYPQDAEDLKAHKWFRDIPWDRLGQISPPFVPQLSGSQDTHYFDEEESISDWSESQPEPSTETEDFASNPLLPPGSVTLNSFHATPLAPHPAIHRSPERLATMQSQLALFPRHTRALLAQFVSAPYDSAKLKRVDREIEAAVADAHLADAMKAFVRLYGRRERKRPRDRLLRDRRTRDAVLDVRKQTAFLGYAYRRIPDWDEEGRRYGNAVGLMAWRDDDGDDNGAKGGNDRGKGKGKAMMDGAADLAAYRAWYPGRVAVG